MNRAVGLVARREVVTRLQQRGFRIGLAVTLLLVVVACVLPSFFSDDDGPTRYDVAVTGQDADLGAALRASTTPRFDVHVVGPDAGEQKVRDGDWDAAVVGQRIIASSRDAGVVGAVQQVWARRELVGNLRAAGLDDAQARQALDVTPLTVRATDSAERTQRRAIATITVIVLFTQLVGFCTWVATGVVEEKSSRVVELVLSAIRPTQLLAGKLLGIGAVAAGQTLLIGLVGLVAASTAGTISIPASALVTVVTGFVGFLLGFAFFGALAAALGSTVSRQEEVSGVLTPVTLLLTLCYGLSFATTGDPGSGFSRVLSIVPPVSAVAMPSRIAGGDVPVVDIVVAVVLLVAAAAAVIAVAGRIYRASVLHSGTRVPLARAWRGEAVADLG